MPVNQVTINYADPQAEIAVQLMIGNNLERARRRMRWAWVAGLIWAGMEAFNALTLFFGVETALRPQWSVAQFILVLVEAATMAALSLGLKRRSRAAAALLFGFFCVSRVVLLFLGMIALSTGEDVARLVVQSLFAYLFFQGLRGALTYHHLTHPQHPDPTEYSLIAAEAAEERTKGTGGTGTEH